MMLIRCKSIDVVSNEIDNEETGLEEISYEED